MARLVTPANGWSWYKRGRMEDNKWFFAAIGTVIQAFICNNDMWRTRVRTILSNRSIFMAHVDMFVLHFHTFAVDQFQGHVFSYLIHSLPIAVSPIWRLAVICKRSEWEKQHYQELNMFSRSIAQFTLFDDLWPEGKGGFCHFLSLLFEHVSWCSAFRGSHTGRSLRPVNNFELCQISLWCDRTYEPFYLRLSFS